MLYCNASFQSTQKEANILLACVFALCYNVLSILLFSITHHLTLCSHSSDHPQSHSSQITGVASTFMHGLQNSEPRRAKHDWQSLHIVGSDDAGDPLTRHRLQNSPSEFTILLQCVLAHVIQEVSINSANSGL